MLKNNNNKLYRKSTFLNEESRKIISRNQYRSIFSRSIEEYNYRLARIKLNEKRKANEEKKEIEAIKNYKIKLTNLRKINWVKYVKPKNNQNAEKTRDLSDEKMNTEIRDRPEIDKNSIIIFEKMNRKNNNYFDENNDIYNRLYNYQEKYHNKLEMKRIESMPTFRPLLNKSKSKRTKSFMDSSNKDNISTKTTKNNRSRNIYTFALDSRNKNSTTMRSNPCQISLKYKKKAKASGIQLYRNRVPNDSFLTNKNISDNRRNKKISITLEYNISKSNFDKNYTNRTNYYYNTKDTKDTKIDSYNENINPLVLLGIDENKLKNICLKKKRNNNMIENIVKNDDKKIVIVKKPIKNEKVYINKELNDAIKNMHLNKKSINNNDKKQLFYHLNIRDDTSNTLRENIVLTTKQYSDFFNISK
jgi:hypothetical protein